MDTYEGSWGARFHDPRFALVPECEQKTLLRLAFNLALARFGVHGISSLGWAPHSPPVAEFLGVLVT